MDKSLFGIENFDTYMVIGILIVFGFLEIISGYLHRTQRKASDWIQEVGGWFVLAILIKPAIVLTSLFLGNTFFPEIQYVFGDWSIWLMLPFYLFLDDVIQYWYHRSAHEYE